MHAPFSAVMPITNRPEIIFTEGKGAWLTDREGRRYLDFVQGWAVNCLGHAPAVVVDALKQQAEKLIHPGPAFYSEPMIKLADLIVEHSVFDEVFFATSGAEANEGAIKLARKWGAVNKQGAYEIITMQNSFHGRTLATMSATGKPQWDELYEPKVPGFIKVPYNDIEAVKQAISDQTVAVMLELVQGEGGVIPAEPDYVQALRALSSEKNILLIVDEIQTGIGRTGSLFAYEQYGIEPDIMVLGKGLGGGVPLSALVIKGAVSCFEPGDQGGTFNGNTLMSAVGTAVFEVVSEKGFLQNVLAKGDYLRRQLEKISERYDLKGVRGKGLLLALQTGPYSATDIMYMALENHLLINAPRDNVLRFMPALNVSLDEIDEMCARLRQVLEKIQSGENHSG